MENKKKILQKYNVDFEGFGEPEGNGRKHQEEQAIAMYEAIFSVMNKNTDLVNYLSDRLVGLGIPYRNTVINADNF